VKINPIQQIKTLLSRPVLQFQTDDQFNGFWNFNIAKNGSVVLMS